MMTMKRRTFLKQAGAGAALAGAFPGMAFASAQDSGLTLGNISLQTLSDGNLVLPQGFLFPELTEEQLSPIIAQYALKDPLEPPLNVTLMRDGDRVILFDAGSGPSFQASAGQLATALEAAGLSVDDVTHVVFTHGHPDHLWGVLDDFDDPLFSNAEHMIGQQEWDYWFNPETVSSIGEERATMAAGAYRRMEILEDQITRFNDGEEILPGVAARATFGHTPGHMSFEVRSGSESVMILGDAIGNHHVSFAQPTWHVGTDHEPDMAAKTRSNLLDQIAQDQMRIIGYHLPNGGLGHVDRDGDGYRFVPL